MRIHFGEGDQDIEIDNKENMPESVPALVEESIVIASIENVSDKLNANVHKGSLENNTRSVTIIENAINENQDQIIDLSMKTHLNISSTNIMSPFEKVLTWPDNLLNKQRKKATVSSPAITLDQWQQQKLAQEQKKQQNQREILKKRKKRELLKIEKEKEKIKQAAIEEKWKISNEIKKLVTLIMY